MNYYLETNAIRGLNKELNLLSNDCYTSALSIFELMAEITKNEKEFNIRRSVIQNVLNSKVQINWDSHKTIKAKCFPQITFKDAETEGLKELTYDLIECESIEKFKKLTETKKYNQSFFNNLDKLYSTSFIESTIKGNTKFKKHIEDDENSKVILQSLPHNTELNEGITLFTIVNDIMDALEKQLNLKNINRGKVFASYNGNMDIYIKHFSFYTAMKGAELKVPAKNDFLDLLHLIYLGNGSNCKIVTNDNFLKKMNESITIEDFKEVYLKK